MSSGFPQARSSNSYKIGLAGCGKMGSAMVRAWLSSGVAEHVYILDPNGLPPEWIGHNDITYCGSEAIFLGHAGDWDMLVIAIKPQMINEFCTAIKMYLPTALPVLSIAAGQTIASFQNHFGQSQPVIRAMPNLPASIGKGISVACSSGHVDEKKLQAAHDLLSTMGLVEWLDDETRLDAVTAVSGSGPAYVFYLIEALAEAGIKSGLFPDLAMKLARQTVIGAAALAEQEEMIPAATLRENVTSPNGTTAAALSVLMDGRLQNLMDAAVEKATKRSKELSNG
jgi:pyrroline-5-carboxylate reductase